MTNWKTRFFTVWIGQAFSLFGSSVVNFSLVWWLTVETGSERILAIGTLVALLPLIVLGPFAGSVVDKYKRKVVMIAADGAIALMTIAMILSFISGTQQVWQVLCVIFLRALGGVFHEPAMKASTTLMVPEERLTMIGGMNRALHGTVRIIAPPAGALLITLVSIQAALLVDIVTAAIAIGILLAVKIPQPVKSSDEPRKSILHDMAEGLRFIYNAKSLFFVIVTCTITNLFLGPMQSYVPLLVRNILEGGAIELSLQATMSGVGLIAGGLIMSVWKGFRRRLYTSAFGWFLVGVALIPIAFLGKGQFLLFYIFYFIVGTANAIGGAPLEAFFQSTVPPDKQGRVFATLESVDSLSMPIGLLVAMIVGGNVPVQFWFFLVGISHVILGVAWYFSKRIRNAESPDATP